ncbi:hypothetical protein DFH11DRAFT_1541518 [Phellopilus nigrolimitatus]|nr:hypothetical protein DFH11DRAFT_1541518 [Phellopilus nigrolimitatus]
MTQYACNLDGYLNKLCYGLLCLTRQHRHAAECECGVRQGEAGAEKRLRELVKKWWKVRHGHNKHWWHKIHMLLRKIVSWFGVGKNACLKEQEEKECSSEKDIDEHHGHHWHSRPKLVKKLIVSAKRVQEANKKPVAFERGFISEEGVKEREWARSDDLPWRYEALVYDKNATLAQAEAKRLEKLVI